jgi:hypothetical protein
LARAVKAYLGKEFYEKPADQMAFQSIKKGLPASCCCMEGPMLDDLVSRLTLPPLKLPSGYLQFVRRETRRILSKGWDRCYESFASSAAPPLSACIGGPRSKGGNLGATTFDSSSYLDAVLHGVGVSEGADALAIVVQSAGKPRPLTKFGSEQFLLKPLHSTLYGALSRQKWLLRGPPTARALRRAGFREGSGILVSGDYKSASDGLSIEVAEAILQEAERNSVFVPKEVWSLAKSSLRPTLWTTNGPEMCAFTEWECHGDVSRGQMMGALLCFPLLCLQNRLAFLWAGLGGETPCLINGDDILFQTPLQESVDRWFAVLPSVGLTPEVTKTSVGTSWGTINSTLLEWREGCLEPSWSARFGMFRPADHPGSLGSSFLEFLAGCPSEKRYTCGFEWFKWHIAELRSVGLPLTALGFRGLLARRLAKKFSLLELEGGECPRPFDKHLVGLPSDFVTWVPINDVDEELSALNSREQASHKWAAGWRPVDVEASALRWCLALSAAKVRRNDYPCLDLRFSSDVEFSFLSRNKAVADRRRTTSSKSFLAPLVRRLEVAVFDSVISDGLVEVGRGVPPPYSVQPHPGETSLPGCGAA